MCECNFNWVYVLNKCGLKWDYALLVILISPFVCSTGSGTIIRILMRAFVLYKVGECDTLKGVKITWSAVVDIVSPGEVDYTKIVWDHYIEFINFILFYIVVAFVLLHV